MTMQAHTEHAQREAGLAAPTPHPRSTPPSCSVPQPAHLAAQPPSLQRAPSLHAPLSQAPRPPWAPDPLVDLGELTQTSEALVERSNMALQWLANGLNQKVLADQQRRDQSARSPQKPRCSDQQPKHSHPSATQPPRRAAAPAPTSVTGEWPAAVRGPVHDHAATARSSCLHPPTVDAQAPASSASAATGSASANAHVPTPSAHAPAPTLSADAHAPPSSAHVHISLAPPPSVICSLQKEGMLPGDLACDPGVVNPLTIGFLDGRTKKFRTMTLTQGRWYEETGVRSMIRTHTRQDKAFRSECEAQKRLDACSVKTAKPAQVLQHKQILGEYWDQIWEQRLRRSRAVKRYAPPGACCEAEPFSSVHARVVVEPAGLAYSLKCPALSNALV